MKKLILVMGILSLVIFPVFAKKSNKLTIAGSTTVLPIAQAAAEVFMDSHPDVNITVRGGGSSVGIASILAGTVDIGDASRHIKKKEMQKAKEKGIYPYENVIANDGIAVIVNPQNNISNLTIEQIKDIYIGKYSNWKELGGQDMEIVMISRDVSSGTYEVFESLVLHKKEEAGNCLRLASNNAVASTIATTPGGIGYVGLGYVSSKIKPLKVDNVLPTKKTIQNKSYKISRTLHMYTNGKPSGLAKKFIDFILSPTGQKLVEQQGFISLN